MARKCVMLIMEGEGKKEECGGSSNRAIAGRGSDSINLFTFLCCDF
jgi:hypothetical protein